jgi:hypothetical protein
MRSIELPKEEERARAADDIFVGPLLVAVSLDSSAVADGAKEANEEDS